MGRQSFIVREAGLKDSAAKLEKAQFTQLNHNAGPSEFGNPVRYGVEEGEELFCAYDNGRSLLITIPGKPKDCFDGDRPHPKSGEPSQIIYCTFIPTGDPAKDAVNIREMEPLTRAGVFHDVRLGMTKDELVDVLHPKTVSEPNSVDWVFVLPDLQQVVVDHQDTGAVIASFRPAPGKVRGIFEEFRERFGFPDYYDPNGQISWYGKGGVRFVIYRYAGFGPLGIIVDERAYLLDGDKLPGLDEQLKKERINLDYGHGR